jgi:hypothetical protein
MAVFWDVAPCGLVAIDRRLVGVSFGNVGLYLPDYTAQKPRCQLSYFILYSYYLVVPRDFPGYATLTV